VRTAARIVLVAELFVVLFAGLVARGLSDASGWTVLWVCLAVVAVCIAAVATLECGIVGFVLGSIVQVLLLAATYWIHLMAVVGAVFAALWVIALVQGKRAEEMRVFATESAERIRAQEEREGGGPVDG
jgi:hypothetical protein